MYINYTLTIKDLTNVTQHLVSRAISNNWSYTLQRIGTSAIFAIAVGAMLFNISRRTSTDALAAFVVAGFLFLLTVVVYPKITQRDAYLKLQKDFKEGKFQRAFGNHQLTLTSEHYIHALEGVEMRTNWSNVRNIEVLPNYILVSVLDELEIIPRTAFDSEAACQAFIQQLTTYHQATKQIAPHYPA